jgi:hypothetical protein
VDLKKPKIKSEFPGEGENGQIKAEFIVSWNERIGNQRKCNEKKKT